MKSKFILSGLLGIGLLAAAGAAVEVSAKTEFPNFFHHHNRSAQTSKQKVTMEQAEQKALKKVPGTVSDSKTQTVKGKEVYWFEITAANGQKSRVWVNETGKVTKVQREKMMKPTGKNKT